MAVVSVRVSDELKRRMEKLRHVNWSEVLRQAIVRILEEEEGRNLALAVLLNERIRKKAPEGWDSTEFLRRWRDGRYGEGG
ncbi:MAG: type II toxin-antitoxin system ParD family antitoxin [Thermofilaceae archaeon]